MKLCPEDCGACPLQWGEEPRFDPSYALIEVHIDDPDPVQPFTLDGVPTGERFLILYSLDPDGPEQCRVGLGAYRTDVIAQDHYFFDNHTYTSEPTLRFQNCAYLRE